MKFECKEQLKIDDGAHEGAIIAIEYRQKPYEYMDLVIEFMHNDKPVRLKAGYPAIVSVGSAMGKLLHRFNHPVEPGKFYDPEELLIGQQCHFQTVTEETKNGTFANVLPQSVKPLK